MQKNTKSKALSVNQLTCERGYRELFKELSFELSPGEILHIKGENGAGKTSLLRILAGLALPVSGEVHFEGYDCRKYRSEYNEQIAFMGHKLGIKLELTPIENIHSYCELGKSCSPQQILDVLEKVGLYGFEEMYCNQLSAGQKRRVALAQAILSKAKLWILDEPFTSLDVIGVDYFLQVIQQHVNDGGMVLLTTHQEVNLDNCTTRYLQLPSGTLSC
ncbi:MAG: cytochrome c biogenesis heme-transporting ATPase CcmA [gamma proteobacterium symbiont of Bathyaustriella thionipta]|nr:cytochrome c biogenesis heme-transporting ATPase CcmA [gamma proteobacterium symbiont of Bathyaustriella thionipta]MCU7951581.1 cytochrome c biogenesis heme-transporting ATPase CcmA [gamma proteobacterium symbiont of Bathyaustriella thionipta]MCU7958168.1 cytochrome c biogenesis heme-transporting ATPase CcmA [gamma proteobacterium symbiont of Bathyaustriella thionipta]